MDVKDLQTKFSEVFGQAAAATYFAPGRINLIGEHTDYNGGHVFPCAISLGTYAAVAPNDTGSLRLYSGNFPDVGIATVKLAGLNTPPDKQWTDYFKGMAQQLQQGKPEFTQGLDVYIYGNLPNGAGLSSSASLELLAGTILKDQYGLSESMLDLIKLGQKVENGYIGVNSGIMD